MEINGVYLSQLRNELERIFQAGTKVPELVSRKLKGECAGAAGLRAC